MNSLFTHSNSGGYGYGGYYIYINKWGTFLRAPKPYIYGYGV